MAKQIGCGWLLPQVIGGVSIASFCMLWLDRVTPKGWPSLLMPSQISCAIRFSVVDGMTGEPAVYVVDRCTDSAFGSLATRLGSPGYHPLVSISDTREDQRRIEVVRAGKTYMSLTVNGRSDEYGVFANTVAFERFMSDGVRSYAIAANHTSANVVDLWKEETSFNCCHASIDDVPGINDLFGSRFEFDSAYQASRARYEWTFIEQRPLNRHCAGVA